MRTQDQGPSLNILVVDDHAIVREGLKRILEGTASGWTVVEAGTGFEALEILRQRAFDVAVIDLSMPGMSGLELLRRARPRLPRLRVLMLSMHAEEQYAMRAFKAGANGYVTKDSATRELAAAVRKVAEGGVYVSGSLAERVVLQLNGAHEPARHTQLSDRELEVLQRLVAGHRPTEIAKALHLSVKTVSTHKSRILDRLQLPNMAALIRYGMEQGLGMIDVLPASRDSDAADANEAIDARDLVGSHGEPAWAMSPFPPLPLAPVAPVASLAWLAPTVPTPAPPPLPTHPALAESSRRPRTLRSVPLLDLRVPEDLQAQPHAAAPSARTTGTDGRL